MAPPPSYPYHVVFILVTELCERFAFYGFSASLVCYFKTLGFASDLATELISLFGAIVYLTPVLGAYVADVYLGRFKTIAVFCAIYIFGLALTTAGAWPTEGPNAISKALALGLSLTGLFAFVAVSVRVKNPEMPIKRPAHAVCPPPMNASGNSCVCPHNPSQWAAWRRRHQVERRGARRGPVPLTRAGGAAGELLQLLLLCVRECCSRPQRSRWLSCLRHVALAPPGRFAVAQPMLLSTTSGVRVRLLRL